MSAPTASRSSTRHSPEAGVDGVRRRCVTGGDGRAGGAAVRGFTLIEILIAMAVLMIGLVGILAVFPYAMQSATSTVQASYAAAISQSVMDAIRLGLEENRVQTPDVDGFLFLHDGVQDLDADRRGILRDLDLSNPQAVAAALPTLLSRDYFIVLPRPGEQQTGLGGGRSPLMFTYPRIGRGDNAARRPTRVVRDVDGDPKWEVAKVYSLGRWLGAAQGGQNGSPEARERDLADPYRHYSFAFSIRAAYGPNAQQPSPDPNRQGIVPGLYEVVVKVYRNFNPDPENPYNDPIAEFVTFVGAR
ncbi:MAG: prepilin-type N-terminal cleavage/methylation domain-containing protein [Planctomycetota bacterium]|nr:MAG: prepilin-type N-terminal cleavage/methylation domain-containing protein [Planctomycetota bacterium]